MITLRTEKMAEFFTKYHIEGLPLDAVLHEFSAADTGEPHDHPWPFTSYVVSGWYRETVYWRSESRDGIFRNREATYTRNENDCFDVPFERVHRITEISPGGVVTLIKPLPIEKPRTPGFYQFREDGVYRRDWNVREYTKLAEAGE